MGNNSADITENAMDTEYEENNQKGDEDEEVAVDNHPQTCEYDNDGPTEEEVAAQKKEAEKEKEQEQ